MKLRSLMVITVTSTLLSSAGAHAAEELSVGLPFRDLTVSVPRLKTAPNIDGKVDAQEWHDAGMAPRLVVSRDDGTDRLTDLEGKYYFGATDDALYIAWQIQRPGGMPPLALTEATVHDRSLWQSNDFIELFLNNIPGKTRPRGEYRDYYFQWNLNGSRYDRTEHPIAHLAWNPEWQTKARVLPGYGWEGETRLPFNIFEHTPAPQKGDVWRYNLFENVTTPKPFQAFSAFSLAWASSRDYSSLLFTGDEVFARVLDSGVMPKSGQNGVLLEVVNPAQSVQKANVHLRLFRRKANASQRQSFLRAFDQSRDRPEDLAGHGKVALFLPDEQVAADILKDSYDLIKETKDEINLSGGERKKIDFTVAGAPGDYLVLYEVTNPQAATQRNAKGVLASGALPFVHPDPLEIKTNNFVLVDKSIQVRGELQYIPGWTGNGVVTAHIVSPQGKTVYKQRWANEKFGENVTFDVSTKNLAAGNYKLQMTAADASGKVLMTRDKTLNVPAMPDWFVQKAGLAPTIPEPFKPIQVSKGNVSFLMGEYALGAGAMPSQIRVQSVHENQRKGLLRAPMKMVAASGGKEISWGTPQIATQRADIVTARAQSTQAGLQTISNVAFEYDGMAKVTLKFLPQTKAASLDSLRLEVPLTKQYSQLVTNIGDKSKLEGDVKQAFNNVVNIGDEERRFVWFSENQKGWHVEPQYAKEAIEVKSTPEGATLIINFIKTDKAVTIDKLREIVFGFMFTPARSLFRETMHMPFYGGDLMDLPDGVERSVKENGSTIFEKWEFYTELQGWPEHKTPEYHAKAKRIVKTVHDAGARIAPYTGWFLHRQSSVYPAYGSEMVSDPVLDMGVGSDSVCWNTPVQDAFVSRLQDRIHDTGIDGFRLDAGFVSLVSCSSLKHHGYGSTCGYYDDWGKLQGSMSIFAARKAAQRAYRLFRGGVIKDGLPIQHQTPARIPPIWSFLIASLSVEGADTRIRTLKEYPFESYRSVVMGDSFGVQTIYLPKSDVTGYDARFGIALLHNMTPRGQAFMLNKEVSYSRSAGSPVGVWRAKDDWAQALDPKTEFWGYWKNAKFISTGSDDVKASFYVRRGEKMLLTVMNTDRAPLEREVKLNLKELGFQTAFAQDAITGEDLELQNGALKLEFTPESYRLIKITPQPLPPAIKKVGADLLAGEWRSVGVLPIGWNGGNNLVQTENGALTLSPGASLSKRVPTQSGKTYIAEVLARVDCENGAYLGQHADTDFFKVVLGKAGPQSTRTLSSQVLPGRFQLMRVQYKADADLTWLLLDLVLTAKGKVTIKSVEVFEVEG